MVVPPEVLLPPATSECQLEQGDLQASSSMTVVPILGPPHYLGQLNCFNKVDQKKISRDSSGIPDFTCNIAGLPGTS